MAQENGEGVEMASQYYFLPQKVIRKIDNQN